MMVRFKSDIDLLKNYDSCIMSEHIASIATDPELQFELIFLGSDGTTVEDSSAYIHFIVKLLQGRSSGARTGLADNLESSTVAITYDLWSLLNFSSDLWRGFPIEWV